MENQQYTEAQFHAANVPVVKEINRVNLKSFLESMHGKFIGVDFIKKDGQERSLNGRLGVNHGEELGASKVEALDRPYLTIYDVQLHDYRAVNLETVSRIRAVNTVYDVID